MEVIVSRLAPFLVELSRTDIDDKSPFWTARQNPKRHAPESGWLRAD